MKFAETNISSGLLTWVGDDWENEIDPWGECTFFKRKGVYISSKEKSVVRFSVFIQIMKNGVTTWDLWTNPNNDPILSGKIKTTDLTKVINHLNKTLSKFPTEKFV